MVNKPIVILFAMIIVVLLPACGYIVSNVYNINNAGYIAPVSYVEGRDFSDGVAWVRLDNGQWHCIDRVGNVIMKLDTGESPVSNFSHGAALIKRAGSNGVVELIDKNGKVLSSPTSGDYDRIAGFIPDVGMTFVYRHLVTFELTEEQVGIIDYNGRWVTKLQYSEHLISYAKNSQHTPQIIHMDSTFEKQFVAYASAPTSMSLSTFSSYIGNGLFVLHRYTPDASGSEFISPTYSSTVLLDVRTGEEKKLDLSQGVNGEGYRCNLLRMENEYGVYSSGGFSIPVPSEWSMTGYSYHWNEDVYSMNSAGQTRKIMAADCLPYSGGGYDKVYIGNYSDELFYYRDNSKHGFFDISGTLVINLSRYDVPPYTASTTSKHPEFIDGYCLLPLQNPQYTSFYTIIDKSGKLMFDPKSGQEPSPLGLGLFLQKESSTYNIIDASGATIVELSGATNVSVYSDEVLRVMNSDEVYYIDKTGQRIF